MISQKGYEMFTKWHDKRDVSILSTNCNPLAAYIVVNRNNDQQVTKPAFVDMHNKNMGSEDLTDQLGNVILSCIPLEYGIGILFGF